MQRKPAIMRCTARNLELGSRLGQRSYRLFVSSDLAVQRRCLPVQVTANRRMSQQCTLQWQVTASSPNGVLVQLFLFLFNSLYGRWSVA